MDREEFFRLKKVKNMKERIAKEEEEKREKERQGRRDSDKENEDLAGGGDGEELDRYKNEGKEREGNILCDEGDEDVIF